MDELLKQKIDSLIAEMTLEEKIDMIHGNTIFTSPGVERLGIPGLVYSDGPHGVREEFNEKMEPCSDKDSSTYLPTGTALAATWNPDLAYKYGSVLGNEAKYRGKDVILGPGINTIRTPLCGRNFEYMSEDPYLISKLVIQYIKGVQDQGIAACVKHFVLNNQEVDRKGVSVEVSERALREIYLPGFNAAVKEAGVLAVMSAYNKFRGEYCSHSEYLLKDILKGEWGFQGIVISDWGAVLDTYDAAIGGTDVEMGTEITLGEFDYGNFFFANNLLNMVKTGRILESIIDDKIRRILYVIFKTNKFGSRTPGAFNTKYHQKIARHVAEEAIVLLKNDNNILPLDKNKINKLAVIGHNAIWKQAYAGGSSSIKAKYEITPLDGITALAGDLLKITYAQGYVITGKKISNSKRKKMIREAAEIARNSDVAIVVAGLIHGYTSAFEDGAYDSEGVDRENLNLPFYQDDLIKTIIGINPNTLVVMVSGTVVDMNEWINSVPALVQAWYAGMEGGNALARILFGEVNPSGKLPVTFPNKLEDAPAHALGEYPGDMSDEGRIVNYYDDIYVGYRYYDSKEIEPAFAFGHGLSYTSFKLSNLQYTLIHRGAAEIMDLSVSIANTGDMDGAEVIQVYIHDKYNSVSQPVKELRAFKKVFLEKGAEQKVRFLLRKEDFSYFDEKENDWKAKPGKFEIMIGVSSRDIRLTKSVMIDTF
jgi:beta-glucosidase